MSGLADWFAEWEKRERAPEAVEAWVEMVGAYVKKAAPEVDGDLWRVTEASIHDQWLAFLDHFAGGAPVTLPPASQTLALEIARRHLGLPVLVKAYRGAQKACWAYLTDLVRGAPDDVDHEEILVTLWGTASDWLDTAIEQSTVLHQQESRRIEQRGDARRYAVVAALLAGEETDVSSVSKALDGYPLRGPHLALVAHAMTPDAVGLLDAAVSRLASGTGLARPLLVRPGGREVWGWVPARSLPATWHGTPDPSVVRIAVGGPAPGPDGFVLAHEEANRALPVAIGSHQAPPVTVYDDVAALTMLAADHEAARRFTMRTLGRLADPEADRLRETVRWVLTGPGGTEAVASALSVHKNTVRYRVSQAERLIGRPVRERAGDLLLALDYYDTFLA